MPKKAAWGENQRNDHSNFKITDWLLFVNENDRGIEFFYFRLPVVSCIRVIPLGLSAAGLVFAGQNIFIRRFCLPALFTGGKCI
ncbi:MAG: hypothetical protein IKF77_02435 [Thermoguttaceae bacterium]|nr:hypothetical protein [Thermoguttaceae bacterium]MBR3218754.1 hypothetical protein [Thermoguttaceae bacterium]